MDLRRTRTLRIQIYKAIDNLNLEFMKIFFKVCKTKRRENNTI